MLGWRGWWAPVFGRGRAEGTTDGGFSFESVSTFPKPSAGHGMNKMEHVGSRAPVTYNLISTEVQ